MGVPLYVKGVIMIVEVGSFWLIKDSDCVAIVRSIIGKSNGELTVVYTVTDNSDVSSYRMSCKYELFMNIAEKLITKSELKDELNTEYVKGKTDGYDEGYQHGFTLAKEKITELEKEELYCEYQRGLKAGKYLAELESSNSRQHHYDTGYSDALADIATEEAENRLEIKKQGFDEGYNKAIKEVSNNQALGETTEYEFGTEDCCEHHSPNKETKEAMQEVLDRADAVSSPKHYNSDPSGIQCIEITRHRNNNIGNVFKYLWRNGLKDGNSDIQDLEKGAWYLNDEIQRLKGLNNGLE